MIESKTVYINDEDLTREIANMAKLGYTLTKTEAEEVKEKYGYPRSSYKIVKRTKYTFDRDTGQPFYARKKQLEENIRLLKEKADSEKERIDDIDRHYKARGESAGELCKDVALIGGLIGGAATLIGALLISYTPWILVSGLAILIGSLAFLPLRHKLVNREGIADKSEYLALMQKIDEYYAEAERLGK